MEEKTINLINKYSKYLRLGIVLSITFAFYNVIQATIIELNNPGMNAFAENNTWAYVWMGSSVLFSIPLLYKKLDAIESYYANLQAKYGYSDPQIGNHILKAFAGMVAKNIPQIVFGIIFAVVLYFVLSNYVITPDVRSDYIASVESNRISMNFSALNFSEYPYTPVKP